MYFSQSDVGDDTDDHLESFSQSFGGSEGRDQDGCDDDPESLPNDAISQRSCEAVEGESGGLNAVPGRRNSEGNPGLTDGSSIYSKRM